MPYYIVTSFFFLAVVVAILDELIVTSCFYSAHKRFNELLSKEEKECADVRVSMNKILTLPELKVNNVML